MWNTVWYQASDSTLMDQINVRKLFKRDGITAGLLSRQPMIFSALSHRQPVSTCIAVVRMLGHGCYNSVFLTIHSPTNGKYKAYLTINISINIDKRSIRNVGDVEHSPTWNICEGSERIYDVPSPEVLSCCLIELWRTFGIWYDFIIFLIRQQRSDSVRMR